EAAMVLIDVFGRDVENISFQFIFALLTHVGDVVIGNLVGGENKGHYVLKVVRVFARHRDARQSVRRSVGDGDGATRTVVEVHVPILPILAVDGVPIQRLN